MSCQLMEWLLHEAGIDLSTAELHHVQDIIDNGPHRQLRQHLQPEELWRLQVGYSVVVKG